MNVKTMILAGVVVVACAVVGLTALGGSMVSAVPFEQVSSKTERVEVYGSLDKNSIRSLRGANLVSFDLVEDGTGRRLSLIYDNQAVGLPANFPTASHARAAGVYDPTQGKLITDRVLTKCPSKYEEKDLDAVTRNAVAKWQSQTGLQVGE
jgi:cytochrome c-type biogenesis protein CcmE